MPVRRKRVRSAVRRMPHSPADRRPPAGPRWRTGRPKTLFCQLCRQLRSQRCLLRRGRVLLRNRRRLRCRQPDLLSVRPGFRRGFQHCASGRLCRRSTPKALRDGCRLPPASGVPGTAGAALRGRKGFPLWDPLCHSLKTPVPIERCNVRDRDHVLVIITKVCELLWARANAQRGGPGLHLEPGRNSSERWKHTRRGCSAGALMLIMSQRTWDDTESGLSHPAVPTSIRPVGSSGG